MDDEVPLVWHPRLMTQVGTPWKLLAWNNLTSSPEYLFSLHLPQYRVLHHPQMLPNQASFSARLECHGYPFLGHKGHSAQVSFFLELGGRTRDHCGPLHTHLKQDYLNP